MLSSIHRVRVALLALLVTPAGAAGQIPGLAVWHRDELDSRDAALATAVGPDHSARETLADYGHHWFRFILRDADGAPEVHDNEVDVVFVHSGEGTLLVGGTLVDKAGERVLEGGERYPLGPGDMAHIPAKIPHAFLVPEGRHLTYVLVKLPPQ